MSSRYRCLSIAIAALLGVAAIAMSVFFRQSEPTKKVIPNSLGDASTAVDFSTASAPIDAKIFVPIAQADRAWSSAVRTYASSTSRQHAVAGIVNHHALAADLIANFFVRLRVSRPDIKRFVIIAPDHFAGGRGDVSTHRRPYQTDAGLVRIDEDAVRTALLHPLVTEERGILFEREHGVGALVPFVSRAYPDAAVVPLVFSGKMSKDHISALAEVIEELWDEKTFILISADMSHYLSEEEAFAHDVQTLEWLKQKDSMIAQATDAFIDSGKSVAALFVAMQKIHPETTFERFDHSVSSAYGADPLNATSYMTGVWYRSVGL